MKERKINMYIERTAKLKLTIEEFKRLEDAEDILITIYNKLDNGESVENIDRSDIYDEYAFLDELLNLGEEDNEKGIVTFEVSEV
jgi:hypothetical protein